MALNTGFPGASIPSAASAEPDDAGPSLSVSAPGGTEQTLPGASVVLSSPDWDGLEVIDEVMQDLRAASVSSAGGEEMVVLGSGEGAASISFVDAPGQPEGTP